MAWHMMVRSKINVPPEPRRYLVAREEARISVASLNIGEYRRDQERGL